MAYTQLQYIQTRTRLCLCTLYAHTRSYTIKQSFIYSPTFFFQFCFGFFFYLFIIVIVSVRSMSRRRSKQEKKKINVNRFATIVTDSSNQCSYGESRAAPHGFCFIAYTDNRVGATTSGGFVHRHVAGHGPSPTVRL